MEEHDNKKRTAVWLTPGVIRRMDGWLEEDNSKTRSEFIEKALRFYIAVQAVRGGEHDEPHRCRPLPR